LGKEWPIKRKCFMWVLGPSKRCFFFLSLSPFLFHFHLYLHRLLVIQNTYVSLNYEGKKFISEMKPNHEEELSNWIILLNMVLLTIGKKWRRFGLIHSTLNFKLDKKKILSFWQNHLWSWKRIGKRWQPSSLKRFSVSAMYVEMIEKERLVWILSFFKKNNVNNHYFIKAAFRHGCIAKIHSPESFPGFAPPQLVWFPFFFPFYFKTL
jgi:hypothetical protein